LFEKRGVVQYNATAGQRLLRPHRDGSVFSFNVALNDESEYKDGGTVFCQLDGKVSKSRSDPSCASGVIRSPKGHLLAHSSALMHGGHAISSGCR
jgi:hypothetical protein